MKYREPTRDEHTTLNRAFDRWGVFEFFKDKSIAISDDDPKSVCLTTAGARNLAKSFEPMYLGLVIGYLQKTFTPSIAGADLFSKTTCKNDYYVTVNENAEKLVLYGRDVMGDSIVSASEVLDENQLVIILNKAGESLGLGRTRYAGRSLLQKGRITVSTIADAGQYLRDEG